MNFIFILNENYGYNLKDHRLIYIDQKSKLTLVTPDWLVAGPSLVNCRKYVSRHGALTETVNWWRMIYHHSLHWFPSFSRADLSFFFFLRLSSLSPSPSSSKHNWPDSLQP
ncbi:hypothetical protein SAY86_012841 [Trapa natans]|uniref:Uncharacterized protein n=1 Tax=Trapa natans TaxID=22666 RepID=A0AAN7LYK2_TRANT|nr:hypothetical protein SAY86_012841 [Trapa natans]